mmetsp:Transcript_4714/g.11188  ORF Transcript_4714/g.11188 Transcript_4714/m.11188 type:complete len:200 (-) Transcript_4714:1009-1608(-)
MRVFFFFLESEGAGFRANVASLGFVLHFCSLLFVCHLAFLLHLAADLSHRLHTCFSCSLLFWGLALFALGDHIRQFYGLFLGRSGLFLIFFLHGLHHLWFLDKLQFANLARAIAHIAQCGEDSLAIPIPRLVFAVIAKGSIAASTLLDIVKVVLFDNSLSFVQNAGDIIVLSRFRFQDGAELIHFRLLVVQVLVQDAVI